MLRTTTKTTTTTPPALGQNQRRKSSFDLRPIKRPQLKNFLNKPYGLVRSVQYEQFLECLGVDRETIKAATKLKPIVTLTKNDDTYNLTTNYNGFLPSQSLKFRIGQEIIKIKDGREIKCVFDVYENKIIEKQDHDGKELGIKRKFTNDELLITMEFNGVRCHRYYKSIPSKHSIGTETSRRQSFISKEIDHPVSATPPVESVIEDIFDSETESEELCL